MRRAAMIAAMSLVLVAAPRVASAGSCTLSAVTALSFGAYVVFDPAPLHSTGSISYQCSGLSPGSSVRIELSTGGAGTYAPRRLEGGPDVLAYNLYLDAARTLVWGDGTGGTEAYGPVEPPEDEQVTLTVYGEIPARQDAGSGSYEDSITVTFIF